MINSKKKGFTIVELVIVIAVVAILAAVLIPTFSNLIKKANESADIQAVRNMNVYLAQAKVTDDVDSILDVYEIFEESNYVVENYKPLYKDRYFFYDKQRNQILYVDENEKVLFPSNLKDVTQDNNDWFSLSMEVKTEKPSDYTSGNNYNVTSGSEFAWVIEDLNEKFSSGQISGVVTITLKNDLDLKGASVCLENIPGNVNLTITSENNVTIKNITNVDYTIKGDGETVGHKGIYGSALIGNMIGKLRIENITFENINVKNTHVSGLAILVGVQSGEFYVNNVTIKNSTVIGHRNVGAVIGNASSVLLESENGVTLENVNIKTVGGNAGIVVGYSNTTIDRINYDSDSGEFISLKFPVEVINCTLSIYECEQNTGYAPNGDKLGLQDGSNLMYSWYESNGVKTYYCSIKDNSQNLEKSSKYYFENALIVYHYDGKNVAGIK